MQEKLSEHLCKQQLASLVQNLKSCSVTQGLAEITAWDILFQVLA